MAEGAKVDSKVDSKVNSGGVWRADTGRYALMISGMQHIVRVVHLVPVLIVLVAAFARFHHLDTQSLWNDEGNSLRLAERDVGDLIDAAGHDIHPPGYYLALKGWITLVGNSEFGLRSLSALEGILTVAVAIALGRALFSRRVGYWAGVLVALSPFAVYYSQETRMYAQLALLSAASMWVLVRWLISTTKQAPPLNPLPTGWRGDLTSQPDSPSQGLERGATDVAQESEVSWRWPLALALINAAGLYTQYSYPFTMLTQGIIFGLWMMDNVYTRSTVRRVTNQHGVVLRRAAQYIAANLLTLLLFLPWLPTAWDQITAWPRTGLDIGLLNQLRTVLMWITMGNTFGESSDLLLILPLILILEAMLVYRSNLRPSYFWRVMVPFVWGGIVVGALLASGAYREANLKFLLPAQIAISLLLAQGAIRLRELLLSDVGSDPASPPKSPLKRVTDLLFAQGLVSIGMLILAGVIVGQVYALDRLYTDPDYARDDYRAIAAYIESHADANDAVILDAPNQIETFSYYYDGEAPIYQLPRGLGGNDVQTQADVFQVLQNHRRIYVLFWGEEERDPHQIVQSTLDTGAYPVASRWYGDVRLAQYAVPASSTAAVPVILDEDVRFGEHITLDGYAIMAHTIRPGDVIGVTLFWKTDARLDNRYKVTVQILKPDGTLASQHDAEPGSNRIVTTVWKPNEIVTDPHGIVVPPDLTPGTYTIIVGLYDKNAPSERLPVFVDGELYGGHITLTEFTLSAN